MPEPLWLAEGRWFERYADTPEGRQYCEILRCEGIAAARAFAREHRFAERASPLWFWAS